MTKQAFLNQLEQNLAFMGSVIEKRKETIEQLDAAGEMILPADMNAYSRAMMAQATCIRLYTKLQKDEVQKDEIQS